MLDFKGLTDAQVLCALYNASKPVGLGFLQYDPKPLAVEQAEEMLAFGKTFDYLYGRPLKVKFIDGTVNDQQYDRYNGTGSAQIAVDCYAAGLHDMIQQGHVNATMKSALDVELQAEAKTEFKDGIYYIGMEDIKKPLLDAVERAREELSK